MMNNNKIITISGLSACGKTTLLGKLRDRYGAFLVPSSSSLRDKNKNFQDISDSLEDNIVKQKYYFELDKRVSSIAQNAKNEGKLVFCDRDFLSALAHNYAVHQQFPETSVYPWMIKAYSKALQHKELIIPDLHIFLDVSLNERIRRKQSDPERIRDNCFFDPIFSRNMETFYKGALQTIPSLWVDFNMDTTTEHIFSAVEKIQEQKTIKVENLINFIKDTMHDRRIDTYFRENHCR